MGYFLFAAIIVITSVPVLATDLGVSIRIGQPGFYGQINLGNNYPMPELIYPNPFLVREVQANPWHHEPPIYLHVPAGHARKWHKHCHRYNACNQQVYFVQESWYNNIYVPYYHRHNTYQDRHYDLHRQHDENYSRKRHKKSKHKHGYDKHRNKNDRHHHSRKIHDSDYRGY